MAQINQRQQRQKENPLDTILKGLTIASQVYGIKTNMAQLEDFEKKNNLADEDRARAESERARLEAGRYNKNEMIQLSKDFDISSQPSEGAHKIFSTESPDSPLYASAKRAKQTPLTKSIAGMKNGVAGTYIKDYSSGQGQELDFIPSAKQPGAGGGRGKLQVIETIDENGDVVQKVVSLREGDVFKKPGDQKTNIVGATKIKGYTPTEKDAEDAKTARIARDNIADSIRELDKIYGDSGTEYLGDKAAAIARIKTDLDLNMKELAKLGAITGPDMELMNKLVPDPGSFEENVKGAFGIDRYVPARDAFVNIIENRFDNSLKGRGYQRNDERLGAFAPKKEDPDGLSDDDIIKEIQKRQMINAQGR